jgi:hypothetical protein
MTPRQSNNVAHNYLPIRRPEVVSARWDGSDNAGICGVPSIGTVPYGFARRLNIRTLPRHNRESSQCSAAELGMSRGFQSPNTSRNVELSSLHTERSHALMCALDCHLTYRPAQNPPTASPSRLWQPGLSRIAQVPMASRFERAKSSRGGVSARFAEPQVSALRSGPREASPARELMAHPSLSPFPCPRAFTVAGQAARLSAPPPLPAGRQSFPISMHPSANRSSTALAWTPIGSKSSEFMLRRVYRGKSCRVAYRSESPAHGKCTRKKACGPADVRFEISQGSPSSYGQTKRPSHWPRWSTHRRAPLNAGYQAKSSRPSASCISRFTRFS